MIGEAKGRDVAKSQQPRRQRDGEVDPKAFATHLKRLQPYLPSEITNRAPGQYPAIDAAGPIAERLSQMTISPLEIGKERWERYAGAILPVAQDIVGPDVTAFGTRSASSAHEAMQTLGPWNERTIEIMEILNLFGTNVGKDVANEVWQFGYACALGRLVLDQGQETLGEPAEPDAVLGWARSLFKQTPESWVGQGLREPLSGPVVLECITHATDEMFARLYPLFGDDGEMAARVELRTLALRGYGLGRLHVEPPFVAHLRSIDAMPQPAERERHTVETLVPADVRASLESAGATLAADPSTGTISVALGGFVVARINHSPASFAWADAEFGDFLRVLFEYERMARLLQENRGAGTFALRGTLRDRLGIDHLLVTAANARCPIERKGSLTQKEYYLTHPALGALARAIVLRGQSHVVDIAFSSPRVFLPLRLMVRMEESLSEVESEGSRKPAR